MRVDRRTFAVLLAAIVTAGAARAENWPAWRGPTGLGTSTETGLPVTWGPEENVRWKVALPGPGNSTPIVWGDRVFVTQARDTVKWPPKVPEYFAGGSSAGGHAISEKRSVLCFRRTDGELLWDADVVWKEPEITHPTNPFCSASPVTDGERVVASHGAAGLVCYDMEGKEQWRYDVGKIEHLWGTASSPILWNDLCIAWCGPGDRQFLVALDKRTGAKVWETPEPGGDAGITTRKFLGSWATPLAVRVGEADWLLQPVPFGMKAFDPRTGKELWSAPRMSGSYCYSSPLTVGGLAIYGQNVLDLTADPKVPLRYRVGSMYISSAVVSGDLLYTYGNVGVPACHDWKTGEEFWKDQLEKRPGGTTAWGSPVFADGRIYIVDQEGTTSVFAAGKKYEHLALNALKERTNASLAVSQGDLYVRTHKHLWCVSKAK